MAIPDSIKIFRPKGTEIQEHGGHFYVYKVKAYYDPVTKKSKRKSEGCIGQIFENIGFVHNLKKSTSSVNSVKEFGATAFLCAVSNDVREKLLEVFQIDGIRIYVLAVLKLLTNSTQKNMGVAYERSYISEMLPEVHLSKNTLSDFIERIGLMRNDVIRFFHSILPAAGSNILFDGSSFCSNSSLNPYVDHGYNPGSPGSTQIRLIYGFNVDSSMPVYFNVIPGNISDKMAFVGCLKESGIKDCTIILDNGFFSGYDLKYMSDEGLNFIMPLATNLKVVKNFDLSRFDKEASYFQYHKRVIQSCVITDNYLDGYRVIAYYDHDRRKELLNNYYSRNQIQEEYQPAAQTEKFLEETKYFGFTFLVSNGVNGLWQDELIFRQYKKRWQIEEMFDTHKNTLDFNMHYEIKEQSQRGWAFIEFLALLIYMKAETALNNNESTKDMTVHDALLRFAAVVKCKVNNDWETWNLSSKLLSQLTDLGVSFE